MRTLGKEQIVPIIYRDVINNNGWRIPLDEWKKAWKQESIQERIKAGTLFISDSLNYANWEKEEYTANPHLHLNNSDEAVGVITNVDLDKKECTVKLFEDVELELDGYGIFTGYYAKFSDIVNEFNGFNHNMIVNLIIKGFTLQPIEDSSYKI